MSFVVLWLGRERRANLYGLLGKKRRRSSDLMLMLLRRLLGMGLLLRVEMLISSERLSRRMWRLGSRVACRSAISRKISEGWTSVVVDLIQGDAVLCNFCFGARPR